MMLAADLGAVLTCVDPKQLDERFVGRQYDEKLLAELPAGRRSLRRTGRVSHVLLPVPRVQHGDPSDDRRCR